jgi:hypothetical protein
MVSKTKFTVLVASCARLIHSAEIEGISIVMFWLEKRHQRVGNNENQNRHLPAYGTIPTTTPPFGLNVGHRKSKVMSPGKR